ncbi:MAG: sigma-70 family RNA polymerase sigma factor [Planctomycetes bacterium]|nr:sigma-70 family RNA polymerase sigma factor [Planctomycetota bacterium]
MTLPRTHESTPSKRSDFTSQYREAAPAIELWARLHLRPPLTESMPVEDFLQETWARAFGAADRFDARRGTFRSWVLGIAYNVLREQLRKLNMKGGARPSITLDDASMSDFIDPATTLRTRIAIRERGTIVQATIEALDEQDRRLVAWRGLEELPYAEIAARLGISQGAAESRWRRLVAALRTRLPAGLRTELFETFLAPRDRDINAPRD